MSARETIGVTFVAAAVAGSIGTAVPGDSLTIRNCPAGAQLLNTYAVHQTGALGVVLADNIRSSRMHDVTQGIRLLNLSTAAAAGVAVSVPQLPIGQSQPLVSQDTLQVMIQGTAAAGDVENRALDLFYPSLPGSDQNLITYMQLQNRLVNEVTVQVGLTAGGALAASAWTGVAALNATFQLLKANTNYAWLGGYVAATGSVPCVVSLRGADSANLRIGIPCNQRPEVARSFHVDYARAYGQPMILVVNSANAGNTFVEMLSDENATNYVAFLTFAELKG